MNSFKIVKMNFKNNIKTYGLYIISMVFAVAMYYNYWNLYYNPQVLASRELSVYIQSTAITSTLFMVIFLIFFIMYSSNFFLNEKKREIGLYALMGIDNYKIAGIFASEGLLLGFLSLILGLILGIGFSKLFMMILAKVAILDIVFKFNISTKALSTTVITFLIIFLLTFLKGYINIIKMNLIDLINANKKEEIEPKLNYFKGILAIVILALAYIISIGYWEVNFFIVLNIAVLFVIIGSYLFFGSFLTIIIKRFTKNKKFLYTNNRMVYLTNIYFRIKDNFRTLAAVTVLITACITALGTVSSMKYFVSENYQTEFPYSVSFIEEVEEDKKIIDDIIEKNNYKKILDEKVYHMVVDDYTVLSFSNFKKLQEDLKIEKNKNFLSKSKLEDDEIGFVDGPNTMLSMLGTPEDMDFNGELYKIAGRMKAPTLGTYFTKELVIVSDNIYDKLKLNNEELKFNGIILDDEANIDFEGLTMEIAKALNKELKFFTKYMVSVTRYALVGIVYFLGFFMAFVWMFATGSILYFKILSESFKDKEKFRILKNIGITDEEIKTTVKKQIGLLYKSPFILGLVHSGVAIAVLSDMMKYPLYLPTVASILVFGFVLYFYYRFTVKKYLDVIENNR